MIIMIMMMVIIMMMVMMTNQPHGTLPLLSGGMPAQPNPDAKGSGGDEEGVVGVEVVLGEVALLHQLGLHGPGDVADLVQLDGLVDILSDGSVIGRVLVKDLLPAIKGEVLCPLLVALGLLLAILQVGDVLTHVVSQLGGNKTSSHLLHARGLRASPYKDLLARVEDEDISMVHRRPSHWNLCHNRPRPSRHFEKLGLMNICLSLLQTRLHPPLLNDQAIWENGLEPVRLKSLCLPVLHRETSKQVV